MDSRPLISYVCLFCVALLAACQQPAPSAPPKDCGPTAQATGTSTHFAAELPATASAEVKAAVTAGRALESVAQQNAIYEQQIRTIAKDPKLSEEWSKVTKVTESSSSSVVVDLPQQVQKLRVLGVTNDEITRIIDSSTKQGLSTQDLSLIVSTTTKYAEEKGTVEDSGYYIAERIEKGTSTKTIVQEVKEEYSTSGSRVQEEEKSKGKKAVICHKPPGNRPNMKTLEVGASAVKAHLKHGDSEGPCESEHNKGEGGKKGEGGGSTTTTTGEGSSTSTTTTTTTITTGEGSSSSTTTTHGQSSHTTTSGTDSKGSGGKPDDKGSGGKPDDKGGGGKPDDKVGGKPESSGGSDKGKPDDKGGGGGNDKGSGGNDKGGGGNDKGGGGNDKGGGGKGKGKNK